MEILIDEYGKWEVQEDIGSISRRLIEPSEKYIEEHPEEFITET